MPHLTHVMSAAPPTSSVDYLHRAGRVGRFGRPGAVFTLVAGAAEEARVMSYAAALGVEAAVREFHAGQLSAPRGGADGAGAAAADVCAAVAAAGGADAARAEVNVS